MDKRIIIYGAGGHSKVVISMLRLLKWDIVGIVDDGVPADTIVSGVKVLGNADKLAEIRSQGISNVVNSVGGIGDFSVRWNIFDRLRNFDFTFPTLIHPAAFVEESAVLEDGVQVLAMCYVSSESHIGFGSLINSSCVISHDVKAGRCVNLSPGAMLAGKVRIDDFAQVGMGATINIGVHIGSEARIGNSAVVKVDVPAKGLVHAGEIWPPVSRHDHEDPNSSPYSLKFA